MTTHKQLLALALLTACAGADESLAPPGSADLAAGGRSGRLAPPSELVAAPLSSSQIALEWRDNSATETGFEVHRSASGASGSFNLLTTVGAGVQAFTDGNLAALTEYCYKVRALKAGPRAQYSAFSNAACAVTLAPPPPPPPAMTSYTWPVERPGAGIEVIWDDRATNEAGFRIERSDYGQESWVVDGTVGANVTSYIAELPLCYRVVAFNAGGDSQPSIPGCTVPAAPTDLTVTTVGADTYEISWTDNSRVEDAYEVIYGMGSCHDSFDEFSVALLPAGSTSFRTGPASDGCPNDYYLIVPLRMGVQGEAGGVFAP